MKSSTDETIEETIDGMNQATALGSKLESKLGSKLGSNRFSARRLMIFAISITAIASTACTSKKTHLYDASKPVATQVKTMVVSGPTSESLHLEELKASHRGEVFAAAGLIASTSGDTAVPDTGTPPPAATQAPGSAVSGEVTLSKKQMLDREFLFSADVQYSSISDSGGMFAQSTASGHVIAKFQILGDRLQVFTDESPNYESDVNQPGKLIQQYPILRQDADTVTITVREASFAAIDLAQATDSPVRNTWVRSIEFVPQGNYLLVETSVQYNNGKVVEFMESLFPRDTLVKPDTKPLFNDPELEDNAARYRLLDAGDVWLDLTDGRKKTKVAERFPVSNGRVIEWYVTSNIPTQYLPVVKLAVEGWNRYSQKMWHRDLMKFSGVVPAGVKMGDPRYNIVNWDSVPDAGAAYESQDADPLTGVISHSMIYLPYAWIKIGKEYWAANALNHSLDPNMTASAAAQTMRFMGRQLAIPCEFDMDFNASLEARKSPEVFANELTKQTLFHEVGHSLGFAHNFKGSLSFDLANPRTTFTTSIMDYNQYDLENAAFDDVNSSNGPLFEYDRQVMSVLYNEAKDVTAKDPVLPACDDAEADDLSAGVDPFCLRYDAGHDPSKQLVQTIALLHDPKASLGRILSLPAAIDAAVAVLPKPETVTTEAQARAAVSAYANQVLGSVAFYFISGAQSVGAMAKAQIKSLYIYKNDMSPEDAKASEVRDRISSALVELTNVEGLDPAVSSELKVAASVGQAWLQKTPWGQSQPSILTASPSMMAKTFDALEAKIDTIALPHLRGAMLGALKRVATSPFAYSAADHIDFEQSSIAILENALTVPLKSGKMRSPAERLLAVKALYSFSDTDSGAAALEAGLKQAQSELKTAANAQDRETLRGLVKSFTAAPEAPVAAK